MDQTQIELVTLANGLRVVIAPSDGSVTYMGVLAQAGSRCDIIDGTAHFVEHTLFKGTPTLKSWQVSNRLETIGGELNAYTSKEEIMLYTVSPRGYEDRAASLLAELIENASFPREEVERERGVVLEEYASYRDNPAASVVDEFDEKFYAGNPLAHNILGYPDTIREITGATAREFLERWFAPANLVLYCLTPSDRNKTLRTIGKRFGGLTRPMPGRIDVKPAVLPPFDERIDRGKHQANTLMATPTFSYKDSRRHAMYMLSNLLGGPSMNSRLNREMRERRGLVYSVDTASICYSDCGQFQVFFACDPKSVATCRKIVKREIDRLAQSPLSTRAFAQVRDQLCGQLLVSSDRRSGNAMMLSLSTMRHGAPTTKAARAEQLRHVTPEQLREAAELLASSEFSTLTIA